MPSAPTTVARTVLVIDDEIGVAGSLQQKAFLRNYESLPLTFVFESCLVGARYDAKRALAVVEREADASLVLLDLRFGPEAKLLGFEILRGLTARFPSLPVLIMSGADRDVEMLGRCLEDGAVGFIEKHRSPAYLETAIEQAISMMHSHVLLGQSAPLRELRRQAARLSPYDQIPVLITGERGTGKERVARYIHHSGPRQQDPFVAVNCAGVPESLFEAEFFGSEKGAFTGAGTQRAGYLERAHGGTLFLDEVGMLPGALQAKLLRVLQDRAYGRVGSSKENLTANFQLISATNADPLSLIASGRLREDFYDRIAAVTIHTPTLRQCLADLPLLANTTLQRLTGDRKIFSNEALTELAAYTWPGNVRELQRVVQEAVVRSEDAPMILPSHLPDKVRNSTGAQAIAAPEEGAENPNWARDRVLAELKIALAAKRSVVERKGANWKAEFMRQVYPHSKVHNAKGFSDLVKRLTQGPWGDPSLHSDPELRVLLNELEN